MLSATALEGRDDVQMFLPDLLPVLRPASKPRQRRPLLQDAELPERPRLFGLLFIQGGCEADTAICPGARAMSGETKSDAYAEGADAYIAGLSDTANPYPFATDEHLSWNDGWLAAAEVESNISRLADAWRSGA